MNMKKHYEIIAEREFNSRKAVLMGLVDDLGSKFNSLRWNYFTIRSPYSPPLDGVCEISQEELDLFRYYARTKNSYSSDITKFNKPCIDLKDRISELEEEISKLKQGHVGCSDPHVVSIRDKLDLNVSKELLSTWREVLNKETSNNSLVLSELESCHSPTPERKEVLLNLWNSLKRINPDLRSLKIPELQNSSNIDITESSKDGKIKDSIMAEISKSKVKNSTNSETSASTTSTSLRINSRDCNITTKIDSTNTENIFIILCSNSVELFSTLIDTYPTIYSILLTIVRIIYMMYLMDRKDNFYRYELLKLATLKKLKIFKNYLFKKVKFF